MTKLKNVSSSDGRRKRFRSRSSALGLSRSRRGCVAPSHGSLQLRFRRNLSGKFNDLSSPT